MGLNFHFKLYLCRKRVVFLSTIFLIRFRRFVRGCHFHGHICRRRRRQRRELYLKIHSINHQFVQPYASHAIYINNLFLGDHWNRFEQKVCCSLTFHGFWYRTVRSRPTTAKTSTNSKSTFGVIFHSFALLLSAFYVEINRICLFIRLSLGRFSLQFSFSNANLAWSSWFHMYGAGFYYLLCAEAFIYWAIELMELSTGKKSVTILVSLFVCYYSRCTWNGPSFCGSPFSGPDAMPKRNLLCWISNRSFE